MTSPPITLEGRTQRLLICDVCDNRMIDYRMIGSLKPHLCTPKSSRCGKGASQDLSNWTWVFLCPERAISRFKKVLRCGEVEEDSRMVNIY